MKSSLGVKIQMSTRVVYGETGRFPLLLRQQEMLLKYCQRLISLPCDHVLKIVYGQLMKADGNGSTKWCKYVKDLLLNFSMTNLWEKQQNMDLNILRKFTNNFKTENESRFQRVWNTEASDIGKNPVLRTYTTFKKSHDMETYLLHVCNYKHRRCIAQFRVSSNRLRIETGPHQKPKLPLEQRLCQFCDKKWNCWWTASVWIMQVSCPRTTWAVEFCSKLSTWDR